MTRSWVVVVLAGASACTTPSYGFASDDAGTTFTPPDAGAPKDTGAIDPEPVDAGPDSPPGGEITSFPLEIANTGDIAADCAALTPRLTRGKVFLVVGPGTGKPRCTLFFFNNPWARPFADAKTACTQIMYRGKPGALAVVRGRDKADKIAELFPTDMSPWIGLEVSPPGGDPTNKASWLWVSGETVAYDGWREGTPAGQSCAHWFPIEQSGGVPQWEDLPCTNTKGFLCEVEE